jgi:hypothetical protein
MAFTEPKMNNSFLQTIQVFLPGTQLESTTAGSRVEYETGELVTCKTDRGRPQASSTRKKRRERQSLESRGEGSHHRQYSAKKPKQNKNNDVYAHLHPLQDYLHPGLDGTPFFLPYLRFQIELGRKWYSVESSEYITLAILSQACAERVYALITVQDACLQRLGTILRIRRTIFGAAYTAQVVLIDVNF